MESMAGKHLSNNGGQSLWLIANTGALSSVLCTRT